MKSKKGLRVLIIMLAVLLVLGVALLFLPRLLKLTKKGETVQSPEQELQQLAKDHREITYDEEKGYAFVNNKIVLIATPVATREEIDDLARENDASVILAEPDLGIYQLQLEDARSLRKLESLAEDLSDSYLVEQAYVDPVVLTEIDEDDGIDRGVKPVYPSDDPWDGADWDVDLPGGANWGVEAIRAPRAWAFLDQLSTVRVGLIDNLVNVKHPDLDVAHAYYSYYDEETGKTGSFEIPDSWTAQDHGSHVSGTMAAKWNNQGVSGILGDKAELYYSDAGVVEDGKIQGSYHTAMTYFLAIKQLVDQDVRAINISQNTNRLIGFAASRGNKNAVEYLEGQAELASAMLKRLIENRQRQGKPDFVICVAAGNNNAITYYKDDGATYGYITTDEVLWPWQYLHPESGDALAFYNNFLNAIEDETVKSRIIVVGAVGIDKKNSTDKLTRYAYTYFSNVGDRVDICAPGLDVYSCYASGYDYMSGTSMATPHITAAAAMLFAANPDLTGPNVKQILISSTYGRYYYTDGYSGLLDLNVAVQRALMTREQSVGRVLRKSRGDELDVCFIVDTTASMGDDIDDAKANMRTILSKLSEKSSSYRVAVVDYRDFSDRTNDDRDYPSNVRLDFSDDDDRIIEAIDSLDLGYGGDTAETVYSGISTALGLSWRSDAKRVVILMGDAPPLDPEPYTEFTYDDVAFALFNADVSVDLDSSDDRVLGDADDSLINVYSIGSGRNGDAVEFFESLSSATGGEYTPVDDADEVSTAITDSIEKIDIEPVQPADLNFGADNADEMVELYDGKTYLFSFPLDENGKVTLDNMETGKYHWSIPRLGSEGTIRIDEGREKAKLEKKDAWYSFALRIWHKHKVILFSVLGGLIVLLIAILAISKGVKKRKAARAAAPKPEQPPVQPTYYRPAEQPPVQPTYYQSAEQPPVQPTYYQPAEQPPVQPTFDPQPAEQSPVQPTYYRPAEQPPVQPTFDPQPAEQPPVQPTFDPQPAEQPPVQPTFDPQPAEQPPVQPTFDPQPAAPNPPQPVSGLKMSPQFHSAGSVQPLQQPQSAPAAQPVPPAQPARQRPKFCTRCGARIPEGDLFCGSCGNRIG